MGALAGRTLWEMGLEISSLIGMRREELDLRGSFPRIYNIETYLKSILVLRLPGDNGKGANHTLSAMFSKSSFVMLDMFNSRASFS